MHALPPFLIGTLSGLVLAVVLLGLSGCATKAPGLTEPTPSYTQAVDGTADRAVAPADERIQALMDLFQNYTPEELKTRTPQVYADDIWFRDGFREIRGGDALVDYLQHSASGLRDSRFEFAEPIRHGDDVYLRWVMHLNLKRDDAERWSRTLGMSHLRFDEDGRVIFQQDYWDPTDMLYYRIPGANWMIQQVRKKL